MITRFRYHQLYVGDNPIGPNGHTDLEHADGTTVTVVGGEYVGGGNDRRFLISVIVAEPIEDGKDPWTPPHSDDEDEES